MSANRTDRITSIVYGALLVGFFAYLTRGMDKMSRYDDPAYQQRQDEMQRRTIEAAEKQAEALARIAERMTWLP